MICFTPSKHWGQSYIVAYDEGLAAWGSYMVGEFVKIYKKIR